MLYYEYYLYVFLRKEYKKIIVLNIHSHDCLSNLLTTMCYIMSDVKYWNMILYDLYLNVFIYMYYLLMYLYNLQFSWFPNLYLTEV